MPSFFPNLRHGFQFGPAIAFVCLLSTSCTPPLTLHKSFTNSKSSLVYPHGTLREPDSLTRATVTVNVPELSGQMNYPGVVRRTRASVVPLLVINTWNCEYSYRPGRDAVHEDVALFVRDAVIRECNHRDAFRATDRPSEDSLQLDISVDSLVVDGGYAMKGFILLGGIFYAYQMQEGPLPGTALCRLRYTLRRGGQVVLEDVATGTSQTPPFDGHGMTQKGSRQFYNHQLVQALSRSIRVAVETMTEDVDLYFFDERRDEAVGSVGSLSD